MSALFDFSSLMTVLLLTICTTTYIRELRPTIFDNPPVLDPNNPAAVGSNHPDSTASQHSFDDVSYT